jgi:hypothetical protein
MNNIKPHKKIAWHLHNKAKNYFGYVRLFNSLREFLNTPITYEQAREIIRQRLEHREENFLRFIKLFVYDNPKSAYLPLMQHAHCSYEDTVSAVRQYGLEGFLEKLKDAGVWFSFNEFKCKTQAVYRGGKEFRLSYPGFNNPVMSPGYMVTTGGTSGRPTPFNIYLDFIADRACYDHLIFNMLDIYNEPLALWGNSLRYAKIGNPADQWFNLLADEHVHPNWRYKLSNSAIVWSSRLSRTSLSRPQNVSLKRVETIVDWIRKTKKRRGKAIVQCYVSQAVRVCQAAADRGADLNGVLFIVGSEPLTEAKHCEIEKVHARVYPRYYATEGSFASGCLHPSEAGELHLHSDTTSLIQPNGTLNENKMKPFFLTSFLGTAPRIMINVEIGDAGSISKRDCGCPLHDIGFHTHLSQVRSFSRTSSEGMSLPYQVLQNIIEDILPVKHGGTSLDYQWIEVEDNKSLTRLVLLVSPSIGAVNEKELIKDVLTELKQRGVYDRINAEMWDQAGALRVVRRNPKPTGAGKAVPVMRERQQSPYCETVEANR